MMKRVFKECLLAVVLAGICLNAYAGVIERLTMDKSVLLDKIKGGWAGQTIGCAYGGPTEFCYRGVMIPDSREIEYPDGHLKYFFEKVPSLYDDIYMDLTFVDIFNREGIDAPLEKFAQAFAYADYPLWHANMLGRYNIRHGISPKYSGYWKNNPHADCIDFQIEADFSGLMTPGMPNETSAICDKIGHMLNYGDGWYGGLFVGEMYSFAFVENDIETIVRRALSVIPAESKFYKCIDDVLKWHEENPSDWKDCWTKYNNKYSKDVGCPELVLEAGNIDATMNSAYVVMGLLYGDGDFGRTMEIACRCGQDSDCNPSTAAGVLATMIGYSNIPEKWMPNLREVENIDFAYTTMSLNKTYDIVYELAIKEILKNGGAETDSTVTIALQKPAVVALEQSFPDMKPRELASKIENFGTAKSPQNTFKFKGKGIVIHGEIVCNDRNYEAQLQATVDGKVDKVMILCSDYRKKTDAIYWNYNLDDGVHTISFELLNPREDVNIKANRVIYYTSATAEEVVALQPIIIKELGDANSGGVSFDFDNDGIQDLFVTGATIGGRVLKGTGNTQNPYAEITDIGDVGKVNYYANVVPADINLDGFVDLIAFDADPTGFSTNDKGKEGIFLGNGTGKFIHAACKVTDGMEEVSNFDWMQVKDADVADFNNDGLQDLVICGGLGYSVILLNRGVGDDGLPRFQRQFYDMTGKIRVKAKNKNICAGYVKAYDLNSDGLMDFVLFGPTAQAKAYYFIQNPEDPATFVVNEFPAYRELPSFDIADVNADGFPEIYYAGEFSSREGWLNRIFKPVIDGQQVAYSLMCTLPWQNNDICMGYRSSAFVDWDGDGIVDIIETGRSDTEMANGSNLDSRASKIRKNLGDGQSWDLPVLTAGSNANSVILTDVNADGIVDYARNGANELAVDIPGLKYDAGNFFSVTINPNLQPSVVSAPVLGVPALEDTVVCIKWASAADAVGNETYEYAVFNDQGVMVAGSNLCDYTTGKRKVIAAGNACQAKEIKLHLPAGKYTYKVQSVSAGFVGSAFADGSFVVPGPTAVGALEGKENAGVAMWYNLDGTVASQNTSTKSVFVTKGRKCYK